MAAHLGGGASEEGVVTNAFRALVILAMIGLVLLAALAGGVFGAVIGAGLGLVLHAVASSVTGGAMGGAVTAGIVAIVAMRFLR